MRVIQNSATPHWIIGPLSSTVYHSVGVCSLFGVTILDSPHIVPENHLCPILSSLIQHLPTFTTSSRRRRSIIFRTLLLCHCEWLWGVQSCITTKGCIKSLENMRGTSTLNWFARLDHPLTVGNTSKSPGKVTPRCAKNTLQQPPKREGDSSHWISIKLDMTKHIVDILIYDAIMCICEYVKSISTSYIYISLMFFFRPLLINTEDQSWWFTNPSNNPSPSPQPLAGTLGWLGSLEMPGGLPWVMMWGDEYCRVQMSTEKNPGCLGCFGDYTTQLFGDFNKPI